MTNEEAIKILEVAKTECEWNAPLYYQVAINMAIEALKAQDVPEINVGDIISRNAAIDAKQEFRNPNVVRNTEARTAYDRTYANGWNDCNLAWIDAIKALPPAQPEQRWIPVSEKLPEDIKPVLVTWKNNDPASYYQYIVGNHYIGTAHFKSDKWYWYSSVTEDLLAEYGRCDSEEFDEAIEVIAWMPLPETYGGEHDG